MAPNSCPEFVNPAAWLHCNLTNATTEIARNYTFDDFQADFCRVLNGYITGVVVLIGVILNCATLMVFLRPLVRRQRLPMINHYLLIICIWDCILLLPGAFLMYGVPTLYFGRLQFAGHYTYVMPYAYYVSNTSLIGTVWVMLALSVDRYFATIHPLRHKLANEKLVPIWLLFVSVGAFVYCLPEFFKITVEHCLDLDTNTCLHSVERPYVTQSAVADNDYYSYGYRIIGQMITYSVVPYIVLVCLTIRITFGLHEARKRRMTMAASLQFHAAATTAACVVVDKTSMESVDKSPEPSSFAMSIKRKLTAMSLISRKRKHAVDATSVYKKSDSNTMHAAVIIKFIVARSLPVALDVLEKADTQTFNTNRLITTLVQISNFFVVLNSASGFFVYAYFSAQFRQSIRDIFAFRYRQMLPTSSQSTLHNQSTLMAHGNYQVTRNVSAVSHRSGGTIASGAHGGAVRTGILKRPGSNHSSLNQTRSPEDRTSIGAEPQLHQNGVPPNRPHVFPHVADFSASSANNSSINIGQRTQYRTVSMADSVDSQTSSRSSGPNLCAMPTGTAAGAAARSPLVTGTGRRVKLLTSIRERDSEASMPPIQTADFSTTSETCCSSLDDTIQVDVHLPSSPSEYSIIREVTFNT